MRTLMDITNDHMQEMWAQDRTGKGDGMWQFLSDAGLGDAEAIVVANRMGRMGMILLSEGYDEPVVILGAVFLKGVAVGIEYMRDRDKARQKGDK